MTSIPAISLIIFRRSAPLRYLTQFILSPRPLTCHHVQLHSHWTQLQYALVAAIGMKELLPKLTERLVRYSDRASRIEVPRFLNVIPYEDHDKISHTWFWPRVGDFFKPKDVIITETGALVCVTA